MINIFIHNFRFLLRFNVYFLPVTRKPNHSSCDFREGMM
jgi:hypothetical protein